MSVRALLAGLKRRASWLAAKPERIYLVIAGVWSLGFLLLTPPLQGPDEQSHFVQIYRYAGNIVTGDGATPKSISATYKEVFYDDEIRFKYNEKYDIGRTKHALLKLDAANNDNDTSGYLNGTGYSQIAYLPQILLVFLGKIFGAPIIVLIYLARIGSIIFILSLFYTAIRISPVAKWSFVVIGLLPMTVFAGAMVSTDAATIGISALFIAFIMKLVVDKKSVNRQKTILLAILTIALVATKTVSAVLLPLLLLLVLKKPSKEQSTRKLVGLVFSMMTIGVVSLVVWSLIAPPPTAGSASVLPQGVVPSEQLARIFTAPSEFLFAFWNMYFHAWGNEVSYSLIGTFGWMDTPMSILVVVAGYIMLFLALVANRGEDSKKIKHLGRIPRWGLLAVFVGYVLAVNLAMYIFYSPVDFNIIAGLQGRYFIPALLLLAIVMINNDAIKTSKRLYRAVAIYTPIALLTLALGYIYVRYYVNTII